MSAAPTTADTRIVFTAGMRFGRLLLRQKARENKKLAYMLRKQWVCDCDCGTRLTVPQYYLIRKPFPKVNCGQCPDLKTAKTIYNQEYRIWYMMQVRCNDPRHKHYKSYGGRGIRVCDEWADPVTGFEAFLKHIGPRPNMNYSVDRYPDPDGNYEPGNVRWATALQQAANKSKLYKRSKQLQPNSTDSTKSQPP